MALLVPNRLLFSFEIPIRYRDAADVDGDISKWSDEYLLPDLCSLDGQIPFGKIWMAWNETGIRIAWAVTGRRSPFRCNPKEFWKGDNLRLCTDMRDARDNKRATRFCQQFYLLPSGGGAKANQPIAGSTKIHRAREHAPPVAPGSIDIAGGRQKDRYSYEALIPADALAGFDPEDHRRIGIYVMLEDMDLGQQFLTVGDDLNWHIDPSTWATGVLEGG